MSMQTSDGTGHGRHCDGRCTAYQGGASLLIALIALLVLTLMGLALVRSVDTSNLIAGNFSMRQAAVSAADLGIEAAMRYLNDTVLSCANPNTPNQRYPADCSIAAGNCIYYPSMRKEKDGLILASAPGATEVALDWSAIEPVDDTVPYPTRFVIDRLCEVDNPGGRILYACRTAELPPEGSATEREYDVFACDRDLNVFYRITLRTEGPKDTVSMVQSLVAAK